MKGCFLVSERGARPWRSLFQFRPYDYGPFDSDVYRSRDALISRGFLDVDNPAGTGPHAHPGRPRASRESAALHRRQAGELVRPDRAVRHVEILHGVAGRDLRGVPGLRHAVALRSHVTVVVAFVGTDGAVMASDSEATESGHTRYDVDKIWLCRGLLCGYTGNTAVRDRLARAMTEACERTFASDDLHDRYVFADLLQVTAKPVLQHVSRPMCRQRPASTTGSSLVFCS